MLIFVHDQNGRAFKRAATRFVPFGFYRRTRSLCEASS